MTQPEKISFKSPLCLEAAYKTLESIIIFLVKEGQACKLKEHKGTTTSPEHCVGISINFFLLLKVNGSCLEASEYH